MAIRRMIRLMDPPSRRAKRLDPFHSTNICPGALLVKQSALLICSILASLDSVSGLTFAARQKDREKRAGEPPHDNCCPFRRFKLTEIDSLAQACCLQEVSSLRTYRSLPIWIFVQVTKLLGPNGFDPLDLTSMLPSVSLATEDEGSVK